jgi:tetratricopeptide (TPR) repeat protein
MEKKKARTPIPSEMAARVLFLSDRTCCVCRVQGKPVQIHHIDENPSNNSFKNLAVLCFDCHRETQIRGGFDRKLDADQVTLYRDDWYRTVAQQRAVYEEHAEIGSQEESERLELVTSIAEVYRERQQFAPLAIHYHSIGNYELRDKYVELALQQNPDDGTVCILRDLQGKPELIPEDVVERQVAGHTIDEAWEQRARLYRKLGRYREAAEDYVRGIAESLRAGNAFSAAFYLKELVEENLIQELFVIALREAAEQGDLWWQIRALEELEWRGELRDFVMNHAEQIEQSNDTKLRVLLAGARGDRDQYIQLKKQMARGLHWRWVEMNGEDVAGEQDSSPKLDMS